MGKRLSKTIIKIIEKEEYLVKGFWICHKYYLGKKIKKAISI